MSGTVCSPSQLASDLGIPQWESVTVPMSFPVATRPIIMCGIANVTRKADAADYERLATAIDRIITLHPGENVLIHTNSYWLTSFLYFKLRDHNYDRPVLAYSKAQYRDKTIAQFRETGGILLAPSAERGVDLPDDMCRVVIIAKVPFPSLGDKQTSARLHSNGGRQWYTIKTMRDVVQMSGRGVRHDNDYAVTYILDMQWQRLYRDHKAFLPQYFIESTVYGTNTEQAKQLRKATNALRR